MASSSFLHLLCLLCLANAQSSSTRAAQSNLLSQTFKALFRLSQLSAVLAAPPIQPDDLTKHHTVLACSLAHKALAVSTPNSPLDCPSAHLHLEDSYSAFRAPNKACFLSEILPHVQN